MLFHIFSTVTRSIIIFYLFFGILIQIVDAQKFESFHQLMDSLRKTTTYTTSSSSNRSIINRKVETDSTQCQKSTITMHIMFLSLEILVILLTYLLELFKKWIKNGGEFKPDWVRIKSLQQYRDRNQQRQEREQAISQMVHYIQMQQSRTFSTVDSNEQQYTYAIV